MGWVGGCLGGQCDFSVTPSHLTGIQDLDFGLDNSNYLKSEDKCLRVEYIFPF